MENNIFNSEHGGFHPMLMLWELLRKLWIVVLVSAIAGCCAFVVTDYSFQPSYRTETVFVVSVRQGASSTYSDLSSTKTLASSFSHILQSEAMKKCVADELGTEGFNGTISATAISETNLLVMTVTSDSPRDAFLITKAVLNNYEPLAETILNNTTMTIMQQPTVPDSPTNYSAAKRNARLAALGGAAAVVLWLCVCVYLRDTVKSIDEVEDKLDTKLLATVYHERKHKYLREYFKSRKKSLLVTDTSMGFAFTETFKKLRTRVDYHMRKEDCKTVVITSVHENEGKSTVAVNLALTMSRKKRSVLLIDGDMKKPAVHRILGYNGREYNNITELISEKASLPQTLISDPDYRIGLILGSKGTDRSTEYVSNPNMKKLIEQARQNVDVVIIDTPPMAVSADATILCEMADAAILVVRQDQTPVRVLNDAIDEIRDTGSKLIGCVFNNVRAADFSDNYRYGSGGKYGYGKYGYSRYGYSRYGYGKYGYGYGHHRDSGKSEEKGK